MKIPTRDFITNQEILFMGYSSKKDSFSRMIYKELNKAGITVYPVNPKKSENYDIKVYENISQLKKTPETAYILMKKENVSKAFSHIKDSGVKRILFQNRKMVSDEISNECKDRGIEIATACPMMLIGGGIHKIHRFFASFA
ncbi:MAG: CoA-binding protein [Spirochaetaceae bacterium]|nr:CoA-binding protein [Spirochaetaceae bacterium]